MKASKLFRVLVTALILVSMLAISANVSLAEGGAATARLLPPPAAGSKNIPPASDISSDPTIAFASSDTKQAGMIMAAADDDTTIYGNCCISRLSSSSCRIWGDTGCYPEDPAVRVTLRLQAYYNGAWTTLAAVSNSAYGTYVQVSRVYNVTPGYYYRCYGTHASMDCGTVTTCTNGMYIG